jgi:uncharacterized membrane protein
MELAITEYFSVLGQAATPPVDAVLVTRVISRMLHILGAVIIGGGLFYIRTILSPTGVEACFAGRRVVWARWVGFATLLLLVSGIYNFIVILNQSKAPGGTPLSPTYHMLFGIKTLLALVVMFVAAILAGRTAAAERARANMRMWLNIGWMCVLAIIALGAMLRALH